MDPQQRLLLEETLSALRCAGASPQAPTLHQSSRRVSPQLDHLCSSSGKKEEELFKPSSVRAGGMFLCAQC